MSFWKQLDGAENGIRIVRLIELPAEIDEGLVAVSFKVIGLGSASRTLTTGRCPSHPRAAGFGQARFTLFVRVR
jgi:hypothetical protein